MSPRRAGGPDHTNECIRPIGTDCFGICADGVSVETGKPDRATRTGAPLEEEKPHFPVEILRTLSDPTAQDRVHCQDRPWRGTGADQGPSAGQAWPSPHNHTSPPTLAKASPRGSPGQMNKETKSTGQPSLTSVSQRTRRRIQQRTAGCRPTGPEFGRPPRRCEREAALYTRQPRAPASCPQTRWKNVLSP